MWAQNKYLFKDFFSDAILSNNLSFESESGIVIQKQLIFRPLNPFNPSISFFLCKKSPNQFLQVDKVDYFYLTRGPNAEGFFLWSQSCNSGWLASAMQSGLEDGKKSFHEDILIREPWCKSKSPHHWLRLRLRHRHRRLLHRFLLYASRGVEIYTRVKHMQMEGGTDLTALRVHEYMRQVFRCGPAPFIPCFIMQIKRFQRLLKRKLKPPCLKQTSIKPFGCPSGSFHIISVVWNVTAISFSSIATTLFHSGIMQI